MIILEVGYNYFGTPKHFHKIISKDHYLTTTDFTTVKEYIAQLSEEQLDITLKVQVRERKLNGPILYSKKSKAITFGNMNYFINHHIEAINSFLKRHYNDTLTPIPELEQERVPLIRVMAYAQRVGSKTEATRVFESDTYREIDAEDLEILYDFLLKWTSIAKQMHIAYTLFDTEGEVMLSHYVYKTHRNTVDDMIQEAADGINWGMEDHDIKFITKEEQMKRLIQTKSTDKILSALYKERNDRVVSGAVQQDTLEDTVPNSMTFAINCAGGEPRARRKQFAFKVMRHIKLEDIIRIKEFANSSANERDRITVYFRVCVNGSSYKQKFFTYGTDYIDNILSDILGEVNKIYDKHESEIYA